jgi:aminopeptidase N
MRLAGNGGYDAAHHGLRLGYDPATRHLDGTATILARTTQNLSRFDLDLRGFEISRLLVNGRAASFTRQGQELVITPKWGLRAGRLFNGVLTSRSTRAGRTTFVWRERFPMAPYLATSW